MTDTGLARQALGKTGILRHLTRLPQVPPFVRGHDREADAERHANPLRDGRLHLGFHQIDSVGLAQPVDELHLVAAESSLDLRSFPARFAFGGLKQRRALKRRRGGGSVCWMMSLPSQP
jgi:hypothetical protein